MTDDMPDDSMTDEYVDDASTTCEYCGGDGGDPWNDGILPCPECDGEGYHWWR